MYIILDKTKLAVICIAVAVLGICAGSIIAYSAYSGKPHSRGAVTVVVDAGHGLPDGGAVGKGGTVEQEINISIAKKLAEVLTAKGIGVIMTRTDDAGIWTNENGTIREKKVEDMNNRLKIMKSSDADLFISIHMNSHTDSSASGLRIFYAASFDEIKPLAENIQLRMSDVTGAPTSVVKAADSKLFLMKKTPIPAILAECGFLSNPAEEKKLNDDAYRAKLAWAIADAVEKYYLYK